MNIADISVRRILHGDLFTTRIKKAFFGLAEKIGEEKPKSR